LNAETGVASQAVEIIRDWLEGERKFRGEAFIPRLAIKFCGGCNPVMDRGSLARLIRDALGEAVRWVSWEERTDLVLIINGCLTACADRAEIQKNAKAFLDIQADAISPIKGNPIPPFNRDSE